jgi:hypothetical protein
MAHDLDPIAGVGSSRIILRARICLDCSLTACPFFVSNLLVTIFEGRRRMMAPIMGIE